VILLANVNPFLAAANGAPQAVLLLLGILGFVLLIAGKRLYNFALHIGTFGLGAILAIIALHHMAEWMPKAADPMVASVTAVIAGFGVMTAAVFAHTFAIRLAGVLVGTGVSIALISLAGEAVPLWSPIVGAVLGGLLGPTLYEMFLGVLTAGLGATILVWATGHVDSPMWLIGLWVVGAAVQTFSGGSSSDTSAKK
jgi:hypothetical protein